MNYIGNKSERGGARLKFLVFVVVAGSLLYAGFQFIPVWYQAYQLRDLMQHDVDTAVAMGKPVSWIQEQLVKSSAEYGIPSNAIISPSQDENRMQVRVQFTQPIEFPGYVYNYEFDHTARSSTFLSIR